MIRSKDENPELAVRWEWESNGVHLRNGNEIPRKSTKRTVYSNYVYFGYKMHKNLYIQRSRHSTLCISICVIYVIFMCYIKCRECRMIENSTPSCEITSPWLNTFPMLIRSCMWPPVGWSFVLLYAYGRLVGWLAWWHQHDMFRFRSLLNFKIINPFVKDRKCILYELIYGHYFTIWFNFYDFRMHFCHH